MHAKMKKATYPYGFMSIRGVAKTHICCGVGTGFVGTGAGWTSPTRAVPMCHPNAHVMVPASQHDGIAAALLSSHQDEQGRLARVG